MKDQQTLTWLDLTGCPVSDQSVPVFSVLRNLEEVTLDSTDISDPTVEALADLPRLETLDLAHTKVTDKAQSACREIDTRGFHLQEDFCGRVIWRQWSISSFLN